MVPTGICRFGLNDDLIARLRCVSEHGASFVAVSNTFEHLHASLILTPRNNRSFPILKVAIQGENNGDKTEAEQFGAEFNTVAESF